MGGFIAGLMIVAALIFSYFNFMKHKNVATFDGGVVTREQFTNRLGLEAGKYDPQTWKNKEESLKIKKEILNKLLEDEVLLNQAKKTGITVNEDELTAELNSFKSGYNEDTFHQMLTLKGIKYEDWAKIKEDKYLIQKLIRSDVIDKIANTPEEIRIYYKEHETDFTHPEQVSARHILVTNWNEAQKIGAELNSGANFAAIAKEKSISPERWKGGDLGYFSKGTHPEVFDQVCFNLPVGEISQVVKSNYGYHIFKVTDRRGPVKETAEEATPYIDLQLKKEKSSEAYEAWAEPIFASADIKINNDLLEKIEVSANENEEEEN